MSAVASHPVAGLVAELLAADGPRAVYQPVVRLPERRVVAYEAVAAGRSAPRSSRPARCSAPPPARTSSASSTSPAASPRCAGR
jgi:hypothetical protein